MGLCAFLSIAVICLTIDSMYANYLNSTNEEPELAKKKKVKNERKI